MITKFAHEEGLFEMSYLSFYLYNSNEFNDQLIIYTFKFQRFSAIVSSNSFLVLVSSKCMALVVAPLNPSAGIHIEC